MEEKKYCIYKHTNLTNGKIYIGQTQNIKQRFSCNGIYYKGCTLFWKAIQKYGWENFSHEIIEDNLTFQEANEREVYWIAYYDSFNSDKGYNLTPGGNNYMEQMWKNPEYKAKMSKSFSEARKKSWSNKEFAQKAEENLQRGVKNFWNDPIKREKRIKECQGDKNPNSKIVKNLETGKIFTTIKEAANWCGLKSVSGIGQCCRGERKSSGKHPESGIPLHWIYINDVENIDTRQYKDKRSIKVICINTNQIFNSMLSAAKWSSLFDTGKSIKACCLGKKETAGIHPETGEKLKWCFYEEVV